MLFAFLSLGKKNKIPRTPLRSSAVSKLREIGRRPRVGTVGYVPPMPMT